MRPSGSSSQRSSQHGLTAVPEAHAGRLGAAAGADCISGVNVSLGNEVLADRVLLSNIASDASGELNCSSPFFDGRRRYPFAAIRLESCCEHRQLPSVARLDSRGRLSLRAQSLRKQDTATVKGGVGFWRLGRRGKPRVYTHRFRTKRTPRADPALRKIEGTFHNS